MLAARRYHKSGPARATGIPPPDRTAAATRLKRGQTEQQLELATHVLATFKAMHETEQALYQTRRRYIESFKRITRAQWKVKELREAGFQTPKIYALKMGINFRSLYHLKQQI